MRALAALGHAGAPGRHALQPEHLAILVLQFICTFISYATLIQNFCDGTGHTTLPDSSLRSGYPCSGSRVQKAFYIFFHAPQVLRDLVSIQYPDSWVSCVNLVSILRLPLALLLPYPIYERLTVAILFGARITPTAVHLIRWGNPPPSYSEVWFLVINPATELFAYSANPCPNPLYEGLYGIFSVAAYCAMSQNLCRDVLLQMGIRPSMVVIRQALAVCLTTYLAVVWQRRQRRAWAGGAGARGGSSGAAAGFMRGSSSHGHPTGAAHGGMPAGDGKGKKDGTASSPVGPNDTDSRGLSARSPYSPDQQLQTVTALPSGSVAAATSAVVLPVAASDGSSAPSSSVSPCMSPHSDAALRPPSTLPSSSLPSQASLTANQAALRNSLSSMPTYRPMVHMRTTRVKIPHAHPSDLSPDFQQRLQQLLARSGHEGAGGLTGQQGSSVPARASHPMLRTVYVREGCIELLLQTEDWGGVAPALGESAEAASSVAGGGGDRAAHGAGPSAVGQWVVGPDSYFVPASVYGSAGSGCGTLLDVEEIRDALQLPGASSAQPLAHQEEAQEAPHSTPPLRVLSMSQQVLYIGASAGGVGGSRSSTVRALSLRVEVLLDRSSAGSGQVKVNLLHQGYVLSANVASFPERDQDPQVTGRAGRDGIQLTELSLDIPIHEGMGLEPGTALVEFRCSGRPVCVLPVLLTRQQQVAKEVGPAARAWHQQEQHRQRQQKQQEGQEQQQQQHQQRQREEQREEHGELGSLSSGPVQDQLNDLLQDLGTWERHVYTYTPQDGTGEQQHAGGPLYRPSAAQLSVLGAHLMQYAEACGLSRTAEWIREGLGVLGEQQEWERGQDVLAGKGGGDALGAALVPQEPYPGAAAESGAAMLRQRKVEGRGSSGRDAYGADGREGPVGGSGNGGAAAGSTGARWWLMNVAPAGAVEQAFHVAETVCLILLLTTGGSGISTTMLACGPGALVLLSRAFLTHGSWARLLAAYRVPRYLCYIALKVAAAAGWALDRPELPWGLGEAIYAGVLLPLCCPLPPRLAVPLLLANAAALTAALTAMGPPPPGVLGAGASASADVGSSPLPAALVGLRLVLLGLATLAAVHFRRGSGHGHGHVQQGGDHGHGRAGQRGAVPAAGPAAAVGAASGSAAGVASRRGLCCTQGVLKGAQLKGFEGGSGAVGLSFCRCSTGRAAEGGKVKSA